MPPIATVMDQNAKCTRNQPVNPVCIFIGATSGIGRDTLKAFFPLVHSAIFYVVGRSPTRFENQRARLQKLNPTNKIVFLEAEISLIASVDLVCEHLVTAETKVDYLYMSPGYGIPIIGRINTREGLEQCFALSYYSRMRFVHNLLPLLRQSPHSRVVSVLGAGHERRLREDDIGLEQHWTIFAVIAHTITMTSLAFYHLAEQETQLTFMHTHPGLVRRDGDFRRPSPQEPLSVAWKIVVYLFGAFMAALKILLGMSSRDCGQRHAFYLTNNAYGPGMWLIDQTSDPAPERDVLRDYCQSSWPSRVWDFTVSTWEKALQV